MPFLISGPPHDSMSTRMNFDLNTQEGMANAVAWTRNLFSQMKEGATWFVPRSLTTLKVNHARKEVEVLTQIRPDPSVNEVIRAMGWTIKEKA